MNQVKNYDNRFLPPKLKVFFVVTVGIEDLGKKKKRWSIIVTDLLEEDRDHLFRRCQVARQAWLCSSLGLRPDYLSEEGFVEWCNKNVEGMDREQMAAFCLIIWSLWNARNDKIFEGKNTHPAEIGRRAFKALEEVMGSHEDDGSSESKRGETKWVPSAVGYKKINVDGGVFQERDMAGVGLVVRNDEGAFIAGKAVRFPYNPEVEVIEAVAILKGLELALEMGITKLELESDAKNIVAQICNGRESLAVAGMVIADIKDLAKKFDDVSFKFIRREANMAAHYLIRECFDLVQGDWGADAPTSIVGVLAKDLIQ